MKHRQAFPNKVPWTRQQLSAQNIRHLTEATVDHTAPVEQLDDGSCMSHLRDNHWKNYLVEPTQISNP